MYAKQNCRLILARLLLAESGHARKRIIKPTVSDSEEGMPTPPSSGLNEKTRGIFLLLLKIAVVSCFNFSILQFVGY